MNETKERHKVIIRRCPDYDDADQMRGIVAEGMEELSAVPRGRTRRIKGCPVAIPFFVAPAALFPIPEVLKVDGILRDDINFYDHFCRGCRLVYHRQGDVVVVTATVEKQVELLDFIPGHSTI